MTYYAERINEQPDPDNLGSMSYVPAVNMNPAGTGGVEELSFTSWTPMTFTLMPVTVAGQTTNVPVRIGIRRRPLSKAWSSSRLRRLIRAVWPPR